MVVSSLVWSWMTSPRRREKPMVSCISTSACSSKYYTNIACTRCKAFSTTCVFVKMKISSGVQEGIRDNGTLDSLFSSQMVGQPFLPSAPDRLFRHECQPPLLQSSNRLLIWESGEERVVFRSVFGDETKAQEDTNDFLHRHLDLLFEVIIQVPLTDVGKRLNDMRCCDDDDFPPARRRE